MANRRYVTAENAGKAALVANRDAIGPWEKFNIVPTAGKSYALRAVANEKYVAANATSPLIAIADIIGQTEKFAVESANGNLTSGSTVTIRAQGNA